MVELGVARHDELAQLVALLTILFSEEAEFTPDYEKQTRALEKILSDESVGTVYVAREEGRVVAMASLLYTVSTAEGGTAALFEDLVVLPTHRGRGIATDLVAFMIAEARSRGVLRLTLLTDMQNERAQALYRRLGFIDSSMKPMRLQFPAPPK
jgi:GNAT superfamily N-acetyltransferase